MSGAPRKDSLHRWALDDEKETNQLEDGRKKKSKGKKGGEGQKKAGREDGIEEGTELMEPTLSQIFTMYAADGSSSRVRVFYSVSAETQVGTIFWCDASVRATDDTGGAGSGSGESAEGRQADQPRRSFLFSMLTDIYLGKRTKVLKQHSSGAESCCISLLLSDGFSLDLEADEPHIRTRWVEQVVPVILGQGRTVVEAKNSPDLS